MRDTVDPVEDERLAKFVVNSHILNHPDQEEVARVRAEETENVEPASERTEKSSQSTDATSEKGTFGV